MAEVHPEEQLLKSVSKIYRPGVRSHKGQNGRLLIIGGSSIFHAASLWSAQVASHFVDLTHYSSTVENQQIFINLKSKFADGIIIPKEKLLEYVEEDDCILVGPGMERGQIDESKFATLSFEQILPLKDEAEYTYYLIKFLTHNYAHKQFVFDAAALQMMKPEWLKELEKKAVLTPHAKEFHKLFGVEINHENREEVIKNKAAEFNCIILLKDVEDFVSDGTLVVTITGGNEGLAKGGSGDALAGLTASFATKSPSLDSAVIASYIEKTSAEKLYKTLGPYFNTTQLIEQIPETATTLLFDKNTSLI